MKVCHITTVHRRDDSRIFRKQCISLSQRAVETCLIVADGLGDETVEGVNILDIGFIPGRISRFLKSIGRIRKLIKDLDADIFQIHDPELMPLALTLRVQGRIVIYDIHENMHLQILTKKWIPLFLRKVCSSFYYYFERRLVLPWLSGALVPQPSMEREYLKYNSKVIRVANFVSPTDHIKEKIDNRDLSNCRVFHPGSLTDERGLQNMINFVDNSIKSHLDVNLTLAGRSNRMIDSTSIKYLGIISDLQTISEHYLESNVGLILYNNVGQYYLSYAIKLFEYLNFGLPVIMPNFGEWVEFNEKYNVGICVDVSDSESIINEISSLLDDHIRYKVISENNYLLARKVFSWEGEADKLVSFYKDLI